MLGGPVLVPDVEDVTFLPPRWYRPRSALNPGAVRIRFCKDGKPTENVIEIPINSPLGANVFIAKGRMMVVVVEEMP